MVKRKGLAWNFFKEKNKGVTCKYCSKDYQHANVNKMTQHIKKCFKCPADMKNALASDTCKMRSDFISTPTRVFAPRTMILQESLEVDVTATAEPRPSSSTSHTSSLSILSQAWNDNEPRPRTSSLLTSFVDHMDAPSNVSN